MNLITGDLQWDPPTEPAEPDEAEAQAQEVAGDEAPKAGDLVRAMYDWNADAGAHENDLLFNEGDIVVVTSRGEKGWLNGYKQDDTTGFIGLFPSDYVVLTDVVAQAQEVAGDEAPKAGDLVRAMYDWNADAGAHENDLLFNEGDIVVVTSRGEKGWLNGYKQDDTTGFIGLFPSDYVEPYSVSKTDVDLDAAVNSLGAAPRPPCQEALPVFDTERKKIEYLFENKLYKVVTNHECVDSQLFEDIKGDLISSIVNEVVREQLLEYVERFELLWGKRVKFEPDEIDKLDDFMYDILDEYYSGDTSVEEQAQKERIEAAEKARIAAAEEAEANKKRIAAAKEAEARVERWRRAAVARQQREEAAAVRQAAEKKKEDVGWLRKQRRKQRQRRRDRLLKRRKKMCSAGCGSRGRGGATGC